ncbi:MAG: VTT domain-containing protein [Candidatus Thiodiazotropha endolucinida]
MLQQAAEIAKHIAVNDARKVSIVKILLLITLTGLTIFIVYQMLRSTGVLEIVTDSDQLSHWIAKLGYLGPIALISLMAAAIIVNPIPSAPIALAAGAAYGHTWGTLYVVTGATLGAVTAFSIARRLGYEQMQRIFGQRLQLGWLSSQNTLTGLVFVSRLLPFISFDLVSYSAGLTVIKAWRFTSATLAGLLPASFLLAHFGGELTAPSLSTAMFAVLMLGVLTVVPFIVRGGVNWYRRRRNLIDNET